MHIPVSHTDRGSSKNMIGVVIHCLVGMRLYTLFPYKMYVICIIFVYVNNKVYDTGRPGSALMCFLLTREKKGISALSAKGLSLGTVFGKHAMAKGPPSYYLPSKHGRRNVDAMPYCLYDRHTLGTCGIQAQCENTRKRHVTNEIISLQFVTKRHTKDPER